MFSGVALELLLIVILFEYSTFSFHQTLMQKLDLLHIITINIWKKQSTDQKISSTWSNNGSHWLNWCKTYSPLNMGSHHWWIPWALLKSGDLLVFIVIYADGKRWRGSDVESEHELPPPPPPPVNRLLSEFLVAILSIFPAPISNILFRWLK